MRLNDDIVEKALVKQLRVRKMSGVLTYPQWQVYEFTSGKGLVTFDPREQLEDGEGGNRESSGAARDDSAGEDTVVERTGEAETGTDESGE